jgi:hypothetical protein
MVERHAENQRRPVWPPCPGFFRLALVRGAWGVPCQIVHHPDLGWQAIVDEKLCQPHIDPAYAERITQVWSYGFIITQSEYDWLIAVKRHAEKEDPHHPCLHPNMPISPLHVKPLIPR